MTRKFVCAACHKEIEVGPDNWSEEDAKEEFEKAFPGEDINDTAEVCDACYNKMIAEYPPEKFMKGEPRGS